MSRKIAEFIIKNRLWILVLLLLITAFFLFQIVARLEIFTNFADLLPQKHPFVKTHNDFRKTFGGANSITIGVTVKEGDIYNTETLSKIIAINEEMIFLPGVDRYKIYSIGAQNIKDVKTDAWGIKAPSLMWPTAPDTPEGIAELMESIFSNDLYYGGFVSLDGKSALLLGDFFEEKINYNELFDALVALREKFEDTHHIVSIVGTPMLLGFVNQTMQQTMVIFAVTLGAILIMLFLCFRSKRGVILPVAAAFLSSIWGLGYLAVAKLNLDPLMLVLPVLVSAMAISHTVQVVKRYLEEYTEERGVHETCVVTIERLLKPNLVGIITDAFGIFLIAICPIPILVKFGMVCGIWALQTVIISIVFGPIILSYMSPPKIKKERPSLLDKFLTGIAHPCAVGRGRWATVVVVVAICIVCSFHATKVYFGDVHEGSSILWPDSRYNRDAKLLDGPFSGLQNPMLVVLEGKEKVYTERTAPPGADGDFHRAASGKSHTYIDKKPDLKRPICYPEVLRMADAFQRRMFALPEVGATESFVDLLKKINMLFYLQDPKWSVVPGDYLAANQNLHIIENTGRPGELDRYYTTDKQAMSIKIYVKDHKGDTIREVISKARQYIKEIEEEYSPPIKVAFRMAGGTIGVEGATNEVLRDSQMLAFLLAFGGVFLFCALTHRSIVAGLILLIPLAISNVITFAFMAWKLIGLTVSTFPVFSVGIGLGVDYGIYLLNRIQNEYRAGNDLDTSVTLATSTTGKAIIYIATTLTLGVIFWFFSDLMFQANMGFLLGFVMILNMLGALLVIPAVVSLIKPKFITRLR